MFLFTCEPTYDNMVQAEVAQLLAAIKSEEQEVRALEVQVGGMPKALSHLAGHLI